MIKKIRVEFTINTAVNPIQDVIDELDCLRSVQNIDWKELSLEKEQIA